MMGIEKYRELLGADPLGREPETRLARGQGPEYDEAVASAEADARALSGALAVNAPDGLLDRILAIPGDHPVEETPQRAAPRWAPLAMAAGLLVAVGATVVIWQQQRFQWDSMGDYVVDHMTHDGHNVIEAAGHGVDQETVQEILAVFDANAGSSLAGLVRAIKICPTPGGKGAHMVVDTPQGLVTVIYMPHAEGTGQQELVFDDQHATFVALDHGVAAVIGGMQQDLSETTLIVQQGLVTATAEA